MIQEFRLPELGENITSGTITRVMVAEGQTIAIDDPVIEIETEKAVLEIPCNVGGTITAVRVKNGQIIEVGAVILVVSSEEGAALKHPEPAMPKPEPVVEKKAEPVAVEAPPPSPKAAMPPKTAAKKDEPPATPSVRRLARELGVDINEVPSSDPTGRISAEDVRAFALKPAVEPATSTPPARPAPKGEIERQPMSAIRRKTALHIANAWTTIPHVTHFDNADATQLEAFRGQYAGRIEKAGGKLTVTVILVKVLAIALKKFPKFNAEVDMENEELVFKKDINVGVAVDTEQGLLVPVVKDALHKSMVELAVEIPQLAEKARARKLTLDEMQRGSFTITNLGGIGGVGFTPIINAPEVAILGVSRTSVDPVFKDGAFQPRPMLPLALSYDHRIIDGADAARFLHWVVEVIEQPFALLMEHVE